MGQVIEINRKRFFSLEEAKSLLPVVRRITRRSYEEARQVSAQLSYISDPQRKKELERSLQVTFYRWQRKVRKLGCQGKGMWLVDFDSGQGYFCWIYPEPEITFFHGYDEGYRGRVRIR